jgi:hypothetical protein
MWANARLCMEECTLYLASWTNSILALHKVSFAGISGVVDKCHTAFAYNCSTVGKCHALHGGMHNICNLVVMCCHLIHEVYDFALKSVVCASVDKCHTAFCTRVCNLVDKCRTVFAQRPCVTVSHPSCNEVGQMPHLVCNSQNLKSCGQMPHQYLYKT